MNMKYSFKTCMTKSIILPLKENNNTLKKISVQHAKKNTNENAEIDK